MIDREYFRLAAVSALMLILALTGCGDNTQLHLQQAQIAIDRHQPQEALDLVQRVLDDQPDHDQALFLLAKARLQLVHLDECKAAIDRLLAKHPEKPAVHQLFVDWTWVRLTKLIRQSRFAIDTEAQQQFDEVLATGREHVQWLDDHDALNVQADFPRARYAQLAAKKTRLILDQKRGNLETVGSDQAVRLERRQAIEALEQQLQAQQEQTSRLLESVLDQDPLYLRAYETYAEVLAQQHDAAGQWRLAQRVASLENISEGFAQRFIKILLAMPNSVQSRSNRLTLAWEIQEAVDPNRKKTLPWKLMSVRLHQAAGEWDRGLILATAILKDHPKNTKARYWYAHNLFGQGEYDRVVEVLKNLESDAPNSPQIKTLFGLALMKMGDTEAAKAVLRKALELDPNATAAREAFLEMLPLVGYSEATRQELDEYLKRHPNDPRSIRVVIRFGIASGDAEHVLDVLQQVESLPRKDQEHLALLIEGYIYLRQFDRAEELARQLAQRRPNALEPRIGLARLLLLQGKIEQVHTTLAQLREQFPDAPGANELLGRLYLQTDVERAVLFLRRVVEEQPANHEVRLLLAQAYAYLSRAEEAIQQVQRVLERQPDHLKAHAMAARIYQFVGRSSRAEEHLDQIDEGALDGKNDPALLAMLYLRRGDIESAMSLCNRAMLGGQTDPLLRLLLAEIYRARGNTQALEMTLLAMARATPDDPYPYAMLTRLYMEQKNHKHGLEQLQQLTKFNEAMPSISQSILLRDMRLPDAAMIELESSYKRLVQRGNPAAILIADTMANIHMADLNRADAQARYDPMIKAGLLPNQARLRQADLAGDAESRIQRLAALSQQIEPDQPGLAYDVATRLARMKRYDLALATFDRLIESSSNTMSLMQWKADLLVLMGQLGPAIDLYRQAVERAPQNIIMRLRLAELLTANTQYAAAERVYRELAQGTAEANIRAMVGLARLYAGLGLVKPAVTTVEQLRLPDDQRDPLVRYALAQALVALDRPEEAFKHLRIVPLETPVYVPAQVMLAYLELKPGLEKEVINRIHQLAGDRRFAAAAAAEVLSTTRRDLRFKKFAGWYDETMDITALSGELKLRWLGLRVALQAEADDWAGAMLTLDRMYDLNPDRLDLIAARLAVMIHTNDLERAKKLFRSVPELASTHDGILLAGILDEPVDGKLPPTGVAAFLQSMMRQDADAARSALEALPPDHAVFRQDLATVLGRNDAGSKNLAYAFQRLTLAHVATRSGLPQLSQRECRAVVEQLPGLLPAYSLWADALLQQVKPTAPLLEQVQQRMPDSALALYLSVHNQAQQDDRSGAVASLHALLELEPDYPEAQFELAQHLRAMGQIDQAMPLFEKLSEQDSPYRPAVANDLAYLLAGRDEDQLEKAYTLASEAVQAVPNNASFLDTLGWIEHRRGRHEEALGLMNRAVRDLRQTPVIHCHLGAVYHQLGNTAWARYHLEQALQSPQDRPEIRRAKELLNTLNTSQ